MMLESNQVDKGYCSLRESARYCWHVARQRKWDCFPARETEETQGWSRLLRWGTVPPEERSQACPEEPTRPANRLKLVPTDPQLRAARRKYTPTVTNDGPDDGTNVEVRVSDSLFIRPLQLGASLVLVLPQSWLP